MERNSPLELRDSSTTFDNSSHEIVHFFNAKHADVANGCREPGKSPREIDRGDDAGYGVDRLVLIIAKRWPFV
jgi:hypothetical protein